ncbi:Txe/YoeB family addiction module toxin [Mycobacterium canetti]|uniref:Txe/YoeB family addiction module toxin n=1 Tax=Mycobacterium canetti TaxID=78331 RepID=UPI0005C7732C|nr:Txe/YoeB family addiction module toxin [Mycobacterium canetti]
MPWHEWRPGSTPKRWPADQVILKRINKLISEACRSPNEGIGKPEPLKYGLSGAWSRCITEEHRLVYRVVGGDL